jgi:hypothetical protein
MAWGAAGNGELLRLRSKLGIPSAANDQSGRLAPAEELPVPRRALRRTLGFAPRDSDGTAAGSLAAPASNYWLRAADYQTKFMPLWTKFTICVWPRQKMCSAWKN